MIDGKYHADNGDAVAIRAGDGDGDTDNISVLSDGSHGSGLDPGWNLRRNVERGDAVGQWSPK